MKDVSIVGRTSKPSQIAHLSWATIVAILLTRRRRLHQERAAAAPHPTHADRRNSASTDLNFSCAGLALQRRDHPRDLSGGWRTSPLKPIELHLKPMDSLQNHVLLVAHFEQQSFHPRQAFFNRLDDESQSRCSSLTSRTCGRHWRILPCRSH